jgi:hypothetical protein
MGHHTQNLQSRLVEYMMAHPGKPLSAETLMQAIGADRKMQVQNAIGYLRREKPELGRHIQVIIAGNMYQWEENPRPEPGGPRRLFEELATSEDGTILVQDEDGRPYKLVEI